MAFQAIRSYIGFFIPIADFIACNESKIKPIYTKGDNEMIKKVRGRKPGIYIRRQVYYKGYWVNIKGFLFLPIGKGYKKWVGLAQVKLTAAPRPAPTQYVKHDDCHAEAYKIDYNPTQSGNKQF